MPGPLREQQQQPEQQPERQQQQLLQLVQQPTGGGGPRDVWAPIRGCRQVQVGLADCVTYYPSTYAYEFIQTLKVPSVEARDTVNGGGVPGVHVLLLIEQLKNAMT